MTTTLERVQLPVTSSLAEIHVHGLVLQGASLELPRNLLADGEASSALPVMKVRNAEYSTCMMSLLEIPKNLQVSSLRQASIQAALEIAFDCPLLLSPPLFTAFPRGKGLRVRGDKWTVGRDDDGVCRDVRDGQSQGEHARINDAHLISLILPMANAQVCMLVQVRIESKLCVCAFEE